MYIPVHFFCVLARSTEHRPDFNGNSAQSVLSSSFLQHHNPAALQQQQQQHWTHLAHIDDRTAAVQIDLSEISMYHLTTPREHHHHLSPCCFFCILLCVIQRCHCYSCAQHSAPTSAAGREGNMRVWKIRAVRSVLVFVVVISGILSYARLPSAMCGRHFLLGTDHPRCVRRLEYNKNDSFVQASSTAAFVRNILAIVSDCCVSCTADR